jgi:stage II sporulation protein D (peptidoglycan lytic transglycosylase)
MNARVISPRIGLCCLAAVILALAGAGRVPQPTALAAAAPPIARSTLRVGMWTLWHDREVILKPAGPGRKITFRTCAQCATLSLPQSIDVRAEGDSVAYTGSSRKEQANRLWLTGAVTLAARKESVTLENPVTISAHAGVLVIAVTLPVESYVERVVASESGSSDSVESLKALAIVVRTFALHEPHGHTDYDLCDSTHCQLLHWGGNLTRQPAAHAATLATAGETLWFHGSRALAYFNKDCGGRTASPSEIWPRARAVPYLPSLPDPYCTAGGSRGWASELTRAELTAALAAHGLARPGWQSLSVARRGQSGRAITLRIDATEISAEDFRLAAGQSLGWNQIPSTWFEVSQQGDRFFFHGRGWGHGVGLCQKGAAVMAVEGHSARQILEQYFPGAQPTDESTGRTWERFAGNGFILESLDSADTAFLPDLARARAEASQRSSLNAPEPITVRAFASTPAFRNATLTPGWVAAFTEGEWIGTQPMRTLAARHLLAATMRHEFLHALVEREAGPAAPLWLREGLVETWSEPAGGANQAPALKFEALDTALVHSSTEAQSEAAHRAAGWYAARLLDRYGRAQVLEWLRSGLPAGILATLGQRWPH